MIAHRLVRLLGRQMKAEPCLEQHKKMEIMNESEMILTSISTVIESQQSEMFSD